MLTDTSTIVLLLMTIQTAGGIYFTQTNYTAVITSSLSVGSDVITLHVHSTPSVSHSKATGAEIECSVERIEEKGLELNLSTVAPNHMGAVRILLAKSLNFQQSSGKSFHVQVRCSDKTNNVTSRVSVIVHVTNHRHKQLEMTSLCQSSTTFLLAENVDGVVLGSLWCASRSLCRRNSPNECRLIVRGSRSRTDYAGYLSLDSSGQLSVNKAFDRETDSELTIAYECPVDNSGQSAHACNATLTILDVNDQGPWFIRGDGQPSRMRHLKRLEVSGNNVDQSEEPKKLSAIAFRDYDLPSSNQYKASIDNDYGGLFNLRTVAYPEMANLFGIEVWIRAHPDRPLPADCSYEVTVRVVDKSFIQSFNYSDNNTATFITTVRCRSLWKPGVTNESFAFVNISASVSVYSQVHVIGFLNSSLVYRIEAVSDDAYGDVIDAFAVTPRDGIIHVIDAMQLRKYIGQSVSILVSACALDPVSECLFVRNLTVNIRDSVTRSAVEAKPVVSCAIFNQEAACSSARGLGSPEGACQWRRKPEAENSSRVTSFYETCSPSLDTCPDSHCDELEMNVTALCPQDCTTDIPSSNSHRALLNSRFGPPRGIAVAEGPCWCSFGRCYCGLLRGANSTDNETTQVSDSMTELSSSKLDRCGATCRMMLLVGLSMLLILTLTLVVWKCIYYRKKVRRMRGHGSGIVPSDYVITPGSIRTDYTDYTTGHLLDFDHRNLLDIQPDPKWEFNRALIKIESVLGEGEFGKVVKAQAWNVQGTPEYTTVAIKMLKECASGVELRDLLSELNLLKQVNHRNVIKLLGVCSRKGPLYVIVEFCEHGSLRSFLRRARVRKEYLETRRTSGAITAIQPDAEKPSTKFTDSTKDLTTHEGVSAQDLLSFAWQIAKGMEYLSAMKVVHRDLAARNILLATGKVVKISDFGLSRDVYEGDAYLKTSKGPLPVKWMAPESLYDQICTTKSDVWSYGVVLWEILTLGANPYPGTPAERLYQLLKTGYRMAKPATCSDELFSVMLHCWKDDPEKRPTFKELADIFEQFLSLDKDYLDLSVCEGISPDEKMNSNSCQDLIHCNSPVNITHSCLENGDAKSDALDTDHYKVPRRSVENDRKNNDHAYDHVTPGNIPSTFPRVALDTTGSSTTTEGAGTERCNGQANHRSEERETRTVGEGQGCVEGEAEDDALLASHF